MATGNTVTLAFAGDSSKLEKVFDDVGAAVKDMGRDLDKADGHARTLDGSMGKVGSTVDSSESKFMGTADVLDGLATTMGLNIDSQIAMARGFGDIAGGLTNLGPLLSGIATKLGLTSAATWLWNAAQTALNVVMSMNPIMLVVIALAALAAGIVIAYKNSETFRSVIDGVFKAVKIVVGDALGFILQYVGLWLGGLEKILDVATKIPGIGDKFRGMRDAVREARDDVQGLAQKMHGFGEEAAFAARMMGGVEGHLKNLNAHVGPSTDLGAALGMAGISGKAVGGPVTAGTPYVVGEAGPELFIPGRAGTIVPNGAAGGGGAAGPQVIQVALDGRVIAEVVRDRLLQKQHRTPLGFAT